MACSTTTTPRTPTTSPSSGTTDQGEEVEINKRAADSDLLVYVNINIVSMDGGWKSTATGLASYRSLRHHHNVKTMQQSKSFMDRHHSELHSSNWRMGKVLRDAGVKVFQIETTINNNVFGTDGPDERAAEARVGVVRPRPRHVPGHEGRARPHVGRASAATIFQSLEGARTR